NFQRQVTWLLGQGFVPAITKVRANGFRARRAEVIPGSVAFSFKRLMRLHVTKTVFLQRCIAALLIDAGPKGLLWQWPIAFWASFITYLMIRSPIENMERPHLKNNSVKLLKGDSSVNLSVWVIRLLLNHLLRLAKFLLKSGSLLPVFGRGGLFQKRNPC